MKRSQLKKEYRDLLVESYSIRCAIGLDIMAHHQTIARWARGNNQKLTSSHFLSSLRKHAGIDNSVELTEQVERELVHG